ncbi:2-succinyl-6-hydroxy-2,4-cyclohexadiene-1-carboxylate synthase [Shewanella sp. 0m-8]
MLSYRCAGQIGSPAVVFLHGFLGSKEDWNEVVAQLQDDFFCIALDLPGHGDNNLEACQANPFLLPTPGFNRCAELIQTTLSTLSISQYHLVGYSLGGRIALHIANLYPQHLLSLVLESCHPGLKQESDKLARKESDSAWALKLANLPIKRFLGLWYQQAVFSDLTDVERVHLIDKRATNKPQLLANCYQATSLAEQGDLWDTPSRLSVVTHFIAGHQDSKFMALAKCWQQQQALELHAIEASGHNVHLAAPILFGKLLKHVFTSTSNSTSN